MHGLLCPCCRHCGAPVSLRKGHGNGALRQWVTTNGQQVDYGGSATVYDVSGL